jgi:hypothetical protein
MSARDSLHGPARRALENDGWTITDDPLIVPFILSFCQIDLGAERLIGAEKGTERIAVEVKSFLGQSMLSEFHAALGQYIVYRKALSQEEPDRKLYLAVPEDADRDFFQHPDVQGLLTDQQVQLVVFDQNREAIVKWKK